MVHINGADYTIDGVKVGDYVFDGKSRKIFEVQSSVGLEGGLVGVETDIKPKNKPAGCHRIN